MLFGEILSVALGALRANKLRSMLTMLGIVIGVAAVIAMVALGTGAQKAVNDRITALGTTLLTVNPGQYKIQFRHCPLSGSALWVPEFYDNEPLRGAPRRLRRCRPS